MEHLSATSRLSGSKRGLWAESAAEGSGTMLKTTPRSAGSAAARRARAQAERDSAEAELRSLAAQEAARVAEAEAEGARREAEQQQARLALDEVVARFDVVYADAPTVQPKPHAPTWEESCPRYEQRQEMDRRLAALEAWKPPEQRWTPEELEAMRTFLDAALAASEHDDGRGGRERDGIFALANPEY